MYSWQPQLGKAFVPGRNELDENQELYYPTICRAIAKTDFDGYIGQEFTPLGDPVAALEQAYKVVAFRRSLGKGGLFMPKSKGSEDAPVQEEIRGREGNCSATLLLLLAGVRARPLAKQPSYREHLRGVEA